jgi:hypothetical protein
LQDHHLAEAVYPRVVVCERTYVGDEVGDVEILKDVSPRVRVRA